MTRTSDVRNIQASVEPVRALAPDLSRLSQIDADVREIDTRAGEANSRVDQPLRNAFGM
jgi:hypothetical protein